MKVGVLGGGQLAMMLAQAGVGLHMEMIFLSPDPQSCVAPFGEHVLADFSDEAALRSLASRVDVVTYEFENVPAAAVDDLAAMVSVRPSPAALRVAQDRLSEKRIFCDLDIPTPEFRAIDRVEDLAFAVDGIGLPVVLKTRTQGYDGKGQVVLHKADDLAGAWRSIGSVPAIVEKLVPFTRELSIIAVRDPQGSIAYYPLSENYHRDGILRLSLSRAGDPFQDEAGRLIRKLLEHLDYIGTLALELFQVEGRLLTNEMAPRVHNSGHWTIEGTRASQFENHLRAIAGLPLGDTSLVGPVAMVNLIGTLPAESDLRAIPGAFVHFYGKAERPGRKVGHVTLVRGGCAPEEFAQRLQRLLLLAGEFDLAGRANEFRSR